ncbi:DNA-directed RNA polymerase III subunit RPC7-like isoform X2 [Cetorhinus maximus]
MMMSGRARPQAPISLNVEAIGIGKGETLPPPTLQPAPLYPILSVIPTSTSPRGQPTTPSNGTPVDWRRLPRELKIRIRKPAKDKIPVAGRKIKPRTSVEKEEIIKKLETLEKKEEAHSSDEEDEQEKEEEEKENEEEYDEEEFEEETDYVMSYFDNGEEFGGDSDENMDEAIY